MRAGTDDELSEGVMSDDVISMHVTIEETIIGEWWWIGTVMDRSWHAHFPQIDTIKIPERTKAGYTAIPVHATLGDMGTITIAGDETQTTLSIRAPQQFAEHWKILVHDLKTIAEDAHELRRWSERMTAEGAIEYYYRLRNTPRRKTLGEVAAMTGFTEAYLRKVKVTYDKEGKWGSKAKDR